MSSQTILGVIYGAPMSSIFLQTLSFITAYGFANNVAYTPTSFTRQFLSTSVQIGQYYTDGMLEVVAIFPVPVTYAVFYTNQPPYLNVQLDYPATAIILAMSPLWSPP